MILSFDLDSAVIGFILGVIVMVGGRHYAELRKKVEGRR